MGRKSISIIRRQQIIEAFYEVAKIEGLENTSIAKIAKKMSINPSLIIHYFKNREELIFGLIEFNLEKYSQIYQEQDFSGKNPLVALLSLLDRLFSKGWNYLYDDSVYYSCYALIFRDQKIKNKYRELHDSLRNMLSEAIQKCIEEGSVELENAKQTAELIFIMVEGAYYYLGMVDSESEYDEKMENYKKQAINLLKITDSTPISNHV
ncbi:TetR family transcriptional regulator [Flexithrix dorotheae]|uniref:TetR family transcriptional regulator n=1 Tax=Flexithrix dorotheae TaxID=70993 RepID=UPI00039C5F04|nr:TetR family transcriptional regulator [Flexithrix dorotheae]